MAGQTKTEETKATEAKAAQVVKYVGTADERVISAADWSSVGAEEQKQVKWDRSNRFQVPVDELSKAALEYIATDSGFKVQDA